MPQDKASVLEREATAARMRLDGASYDEIASACGYASRPGAYGAVQRALARSIKEPADEIRKMELARLDRLHEAVWPVATANPPDLAAVASVLKIMKRRAELLGLDAAKQIEGAVILKSYAVGNAPEDL